MDLEHGYPIPASEHETEEVIRRSRFRTIVAPADTPEAAHAFVQRVRDRYPDASHHCWAFVLGPPGNTARVGMSDDGEPSGTAGRPMLTTLLHSGVGEVVAVCVRWYGGTNLGTGGLQRAYTSGVKRTLEKLPVRERIARTRLEIVFAYAHVDAVQHLLGVAGGEIHQEQYGADVRYRIELPEIRRTSFTRSLADLTSGDAEVRRLD
jgi:uncharacterized YigZ family protein